MNSTSAMPTFGKHTGGFKAMAITGDELVGYLRAEFDKASHWRLWLLFVQFLAAVPGALSVVVTDKSTTYFLALAAPAAIGVWWIVRRTYLRAKCAAHTARRASLILGGLGAQFSPEEHQRLREAFTIDETTARAAINHTYYASEAVPGLTRLGQMIEESAFYSKEIHRLSALAMWAFFCLFAAAALAIALGALPYAARDTAIAAVRVWLALLVFLLSSDVLGAASEHSEASRLAGAVQVRLSAADARGYPEGDVLLAMVDYNSAMEGAPEAVPGVFKAIEGRLNRRWAEYERDRGLARRARAVA